MFGKKRKENALPAVWFSSLLLFHVTTGAECEQPISLAVGELLHCWTRPNIWNFLHLSHIFLHTSFAAQQSLCGSSAPHSPTCRMQSWWHFFSKLTHVQSSLNSYPVDDSHPHGTWKWSNCFLSAPPPLAWCVDCSFSCLLLFFVCWFVCFQNLFVELRANKAGRHRDPNGNWQ